MRIRGDKDSFWPSYVDIMTTLFAVMVVLFAVSFTRFRANEKELEFLVARYNEIKSIYEMVEKIDSNYFEFNEEYVKFIFKIQVTFQRGRFDIESELQDDVMNPLRADSLRTQIVQAGEEIKRTIESLQNSETKQDIK